ncbi:MAG: TlpA family protein disulfide reductase, partial [Proteobacteria bacterium]|nr:TlpA family protein disulfide reductase [Pseudomonadota bacterium]
MWQALREELHPDGLEIVTVGLDSLGVEGCGPFIEAANPQHPSLIDQHHVLAEKFGVI